MKLLLDAFHKIAIIAEMIVGVSGKLVKAPRNTVALAGYSTTLNCSTDLTPSDNILQWQLLQEGMMQTKTLYNGNINPNYSQRLIIEKYEEDGEFFINILFKSVVMDDGGTYTCQDDYGVGEAEGASLIILEEEPTCVVTTDEAAAFMDDGLINLIPNETARITCHVGYHGAHRPIYTWLDCPYIQSADDNHNGTASSFIVVMAGRMAINCTVSVDFSKLEEGGSSDRVPPSYEYYITSYINVSYGVESVTFTIANASVLEPGHILTAESDSNPVAWYVWDGLGPNGTIIHEESSSVKLMKEGEYHLTCTASNTVRSQLYTASTDITVAVKRKTVTSAATVLLKDSPDHILGLIFVLTVAALRITQDSMKL